MKSKKNNFRGILSIVLVSATIAAIMVGLSFFKPEIEKEEKVDENVNVTVTHTLVVDTYPVIGVSGRVEPNKIVTLIAETQGILEHRSAQAWQGKQFKAGQSLLKIDDSNAQAQYSQAVSQAAVAEQNYLLEKELSKRSKEEWKAEYSKRVPELVARAPQLKASKASYQAAKDNQKAAKEILDSTQVNAPFSGIVEQIFVQEGEYVRTGQELIRVHDTTRYQIQFQLSLDQLDSLHLPPIINRPLEKVEVLVHSVVNPSLTWPGKLVRSSGILDPDTLLMSLFVEIASPLDASKHSYPLLSGQFVEAKIKNQVTEKTVAIPKSALQQNNIVYVVDERDALVFIEVSIAENEPVQPLKDGWILVKGIQGDQRVVVGQLTNIVSGTVVIPTEVDQALVN